MNQITASQTKRSRIAVIGGGISGLAAAWALRKTHQISLYEKRDRLGGHAHTVKIDYLGDPIEVDTGFIVYNTLNYPNFTPFLKALGVSSHETDMSFGFSLDRNLEWSSNGLEGLFANPLNLLRPNFLKMLIDILRFNSQAQKDLRTGQLEGYTLGQYLDQLKLSNAFRQYYLFPMGAAIWSSSETDIEDYPAEAFIRFFNNHRLMHAKRPKWASIQGGSKNYVERVESDLKAENVQFEAEVVRVERTESGVELTDCLGETKCFDDVIFACHSDQVLKLLADPSDDEYQLLKSIPYGKNRVVLHRDPSLVPKRKGARASWQYLRHTGQSEASLTYDMNRLQNIASDKPLYVTLNPGREPAPELTFGEYQYDHPQFTTAGLAAQRIFNKIQGVNRVWFTGAWLGYGFHEDGLRSGFRVALRLGGEIPWEFVEGDITGGSWGKRPTDDHNQPVVTAAE